MGKPSSKSRGDLHGLRCQHCAGSLSKEMETSEWTVSPLIRDSFSMIGSAVGGTTRAFYGFNHRMNDVISFRMIAMPFVRRWIKGPMWLHFLIGVDLFRHLFNSPLHLIMQLCHLHHRHRVHPHSIRK